MRYLLMLTLLCTTAYAQYPVPRNMSLPRGDARILEFTTETDLTGDSIAFTVTLGYQETYSTSTYATLRKVNRHGLGGDDEQVFVTDSLSGAVKVYLSRANSLLLTERQYFYTLRVNDTTKYYGVLNVMPSTISSATAGTVLDTRTISTTAPLMGGGNLTQDRTFAINPDSLMAYRNTGTDTSATWLVAFLQSVLPGYDSHIASTSNPHNVTATQVGAPPTSRNISTTAPLQGGGDLSANRTFSIHPDTLIEYRRDTSGTFALSVAQAAAVEADTVGNFALSVAQSASVAADLANDSALAANSTAISATNDLAAHEANTSNPHSVTAAQTGAAASNILDSLSLLDRSINTTGRVVSVADSLTGTAINWAASNVFYATLAGDVTFTFTGAQAGQQITVRITQSSGGSNTVAFPAAVRWTGGTAPTMTATANQIDVFTFVYDGVYYVGSYVQNM